MKISHYLVIALGAAITWVASARADCCSKEADCPDGFICGPGGCELKAVDCHCDSDCPTDFRCMQEAVNACPASDPTHCKRVGVCAAPWQAPCATDVDCGAGFRCADSGSVCGPNSCQPYTKCEQLELPDACAKDTDCPSGWTCENDHAWSEQCVKRIGGCPSDGDCLPHPGKNQCRPPYWALGGDFSYVGPPPKHDGCSGAAGPDVGIDGGPTGADGVSDAGSIAFRGTRDAGATDSGPNASRHTRDASTMRGTPINSGCQATPAAASGTLSPCLVALWLAARRRRSAKQKPPSMGQQGLLGTSRCNARAATPSNATSEASTNTSG